MMEDTPQWRAIQERIQRRFPAVVRESAPLIEPVLPNPVRKRTWKPKRTPLYLLPTPTSTPGAYKPCIACGQCIRWALASCFDCNRVLVVDQRASLQPRFLYFT